MHPLAGSCKSGAKWPQMKLSSTCSSVSDATSATTSTGAFAPLTAAVLSPLAGALPMPLTAPFARLTASLAPRVATTNAGPDMPNAADAFPGTRRPSRIETLGRSAQVLFAVAMLFVAGMLASGCCANSASRTSPSDLGRAFRRNVRAVKVSAGANGGAVEFDFRDPSKDGTGDFTTKDTKRTKGDADENVTATVAKRTKGNAEEDVTATVAKSAKENTEKDVTATNATVATGESIHSSPITIHCPFFHSAGFQPLAFSLQPFPPIPFFSRSGRETHAQFALPRQLKTTHLELPERALFKERLRAKHQILAQRALFPI